MTLSSWADEEKAPVMQASDVKQLSNAQWHQTIDAANEETQQLLSENEKLGGE